VAILRLLSKTSRGIKTGLALAVAAGSVAFLLVSPFFLSVFKDQFLDSQRFFFVMGLLASTQVVFVASAIRTYYSMEREADDRRMLRRGIVGSLLVAFLLFFLFSTEDGNYIPRIPGNEASATATLRALNAAESAYASSHQSSFSDTLTKLCSPPSGATAGASLKDPFLCSKIGQSPATFTKNGYVFTYVPVEKEREIASYTIHADPESRGSSGRRSFFTDNSGILRKNTSNPATAGDNPI
jgi:hypothetical protein